MRHTLLFWFAIAAVLVALANAGQRTVTLGNNGGKQQQQQQPMFTSEAIANSAIRRKAQEDILSRSRLNRERSPGSPQTPLSGGSGVSSPGAGSGTRIASPELARPAAQKPSTFLRDPPPARGAAKPTANTVASSSSERKPSCASLCQTVYVQPARPTCIFDSFTNEFVSLRNTAHIACYKCLNPNSRIDVRAKQSDCDGQHPRNRRNIGE